MTLRVRKLRAIAYYTQLWAAGLATQVGLRPPNDRMLRPRIAGDVPRPTAHDVIRFLERTGGSVEAYRLPDGALMMPHGWFSTWGVPELGRALLAAHLPLNLGNIVHAGTSIRIHRLPAVHEPLRFAATVETVVHTGSRVRIEQNLVTTTAKGEAVAEHGISLLVLGAGQRPWSNKGRRQEFVPSAAEPLASFDLSKSEGWQFAQMSCDFNPVHWLPPFARLSGLPGTVAHGFDLFTRIGHAAVASLTESQPARLRTIEARFRQPVVLPARLTVFAGASQTTQSGYRRYPLWLATDPAASVNALAFVEVET